MEISTVLVALLFMTASACALFASFAQIGAWAHSNEVQGWTDLLDSPMPKLFVDFSLFFRGLPDDSHPDVVRARHVRLSVLGWKWLRAGSITALVASVIQLWTSIAAIA